MTRTYVPAERPEGKAWTHADKIAVTSCIFMNLALKNNTAKFRRKQNFRKILQLNLIEWLIYCNH